MTHPTAEQIHDRRTKGRLVATRGRRADESAGTYLALLGGRRLADAVDSWELFPLKTAALVNGK
ncbi:hypothetical protein [Cupriavidus sp. DF5525]|uniref:hypothetical protein n=1 Tax=Cupriavidus sp. DF5525 TaxID=3160989 RepID=UPI0032DF5361